MKKAIATISTLIIFSASLSVCAENAENSINNSDGVLPIYNTSIRQSDSDVYIAEALPSYFDLRNVDGKSYVSSVKDQGNTNNCWAQAFCSSVESCWLRNTDGQEEIDVSDNHIDYSTTRNINGQINPDGSKNNINSGGNAFLAAAYASRGSGVVLENEFSNESSYLSETYIQPSFGVTGVNIYNYIIGFEDGDLSDEFYNQAIIDMKSNLIKYKTSIAASIQYDYDFIGSLYPAFYNPNGEYDYSNHTVSIIGWDDSYPSENFNVQPKGDGAWIAKDSYGTDAEGRDEGYVYISYYDYSVYSISTQVTEVEDYRDGVPYDNRYYYDKGMYHDAVGYENNGNVAYGMNIFSKQDGIEKVESVNLAFNGPTEYEIYIQDNVVDAESIDVESLTPCVTGSIDSAGYYQIDFDNTVQVNGDKFAVIVRYYDSQSNNIVPIYKKAPYEYYWYDTDISFKAETSYISPDGCTWEDISEKDSCCTIKAFTTDIDKKSVVRLNKICSDSSPTQTTMIYVYDENNNFVNPNADGTYSLSDGVYTYIAQRLPLYVSYGKTMYFEDSHGSFEVNGEDMVLDISVPQTGDYTKPDASPTLVQPGIIETSNHDGNVYFNFGSGTMAAKDLKVYLVHEDGTREELVYGKDYMYSYAYEGMKMLNFSNGYDYDNAQQVPLLFKNTKRMYELKDKLLTMEVVFDDPNNTLFRLYVSFDEVDYLRQINSLIISDRFTTKEDIADCAMSMYGTTDIEFSDDFMITPARLDGSITITNNGKKYTQDYSNYNRITATIKYVKKTPTGIMYKMDYLVNNSWAYYYDKYVALYDEQGVLQNVDSDYFEQYFEVPYKDKSKTLKLFIWDSNNGIEYPVYDAITLDLNNE